MPEGEHALPAPVAPKFAETAAKGMQLLADTWRWPTTASLPKRSATSPSKMALQRLRPATNRWHNEPRIARRPAPPGMAAPKIPNKENAEEVALLHVFR
jgi:hypothetical protein